MLNVTLCMYIFYRIFQGELSLRAVILKSHVVKPKSPHQGFKFQRAPTATTRSQAFAAAWLDR